MSVILILIVASLTMALIFLGGFIWSVRSGQYEDTVTPSMRVLMEESGGGNPDLPSNSRLPLTLTLSRRERLHEPPRLTNGDPEPRTVAGRVTPGAPPPRSTKPGAHGVTRPTQHFMDREGPSSAADLSDARNLQDRRTIPPVPCAATGRAHGGAGEPCEVKASKFPLNCDQTKK